MTEEQNYPPKEVMKSEEPEDSALCWVCGMMYPNKEYDEKRDGYYGDKSHPCDDSVPVNVSFVIAPKERDDADAGKIGTLQRTMHEAHAEARWDKIHLAELDLLTEGISFDAGTGFGCRDWMFENHPPEVRKKIIARAKAIASELGIELEL